MPGRSALRELSKIQVFRTCGNVGPTAARSVEAGNSGYSVTRRSSFTASPSARDGGPPRRSWPRWQAFPCKLRFTGAMPVLLGYRIEAVDRGHRLCGRCPTTDTLESRHPGGARLHRAWAGSFTILRVFSTGTSLRVVPFETQLRPRDALCLRRGEDGETHFEEILTVQIPTIGRVGRCVGEHMR